MVPARPDVRLLRSYSEAPARVMRSFCEASAKFGEALARLLRGSREASARLSRSHRGFCEAPAKLLVHPAMALRRSCVALARSHTRFLLSPYMASCEGPSKLLRGSAMSLRSPCTVSASNARDFCEALRPICVSCEVLCEAFAKILRGPCEAAASANLLLLCEARALLLRSPRETASMFARPLGGFARLNAKLLRRFYEAPCQGHVGRLRNSFEDFSKLVHGSCEASASVQREAFEAPAWLLQGIMRGSCEAPARPCEGPARGARAR